MDPLTVAPTKPTLTPVLFLTSHPPTLILFLAVSRGRGRGCDTNNCICPNRPAGCWLWHSDGYG